MLLGAPDNDRGMLTLLAALPLSAPSTLIRGGTLVDGSGAAPRRADVRVVGDLVAEVGHLQARPGERVVDATGFVVAPGFIDAHSHADGGIAKDPTAASQITQGITTAVVGQDGGWAGPITDTFARLRATRPALNFAVFSGHGGIRGRVLGKDFKRAATADEIARMAALVDADMRAGALGLSSGLEYDPGYYSTTDELIELNRPVGRVRGVTISHVRDEADKAFEAFEELQRVARESGAHGQISHIKLGSAAVWGKAAEVCARFIGPSASADVYPYTFWQSTMAALTPSRAWERRDIWVKALADVGGAKNVRLTNYSPEPKWVGKTLLELSSQTHRDPISLIQEILRKTHLPGKEGSESVAVQAMTEADLQTFIRHPRVMFCSDGQIGGSHPRGAGSFPRVLGRYVRELRVLTLQEAVRRMTSLPAATLGLSNRGLVRAGYAADIVIFDPKTIADRATAKDPTLLSVGVRDVLVSGVPVLAGGRTIGARSGRVLLRG